MKTIAAGKQEPERTVNSRGWKWWLSLTVALVAIAGAAAWGALRYYPKWSEDRLVRRARSSLESKDFDSAALTIRRVLQLNDRSIPATELMAEMADAVKAPQALTWHQRVVELQPDRLDLRLNLAERALETGQPALAQEILSRAFDRGASNARYHFLTGQLAILANDHRKAEKELALAVKLEPENQTYQFNQAAQRLVYGDASVWDEARKTIENSLKLPALFPRASRALVVDALRGSDANRAITLADALRKRPGASFDDQLFYLELLRSLKRPEYASFLTELQQQAAGDPLDLYKLITWLNTNRSALLAVEWSKRLPADLLSKMPVPIALAQSYVTLGDWAGLKPLIETPSISEAVGVNARDKEGGVDEKLEGDKPGNWKTFEFIRLAMLARTLHDQGNLSEAKVQWNAAIKSAGSRVESLSILARAATDWGWENESTELLWLVARSSEDPRWALEILYRRYVATNSTRNIHQVMSRMHEVYPTEEWVINSLAMLSLLSGSNTEQGIKLAEEVYQKNPENPTYKSTYAYALHLQGRTPEALVIMKSLGEDNLVRPEHAAYYGILLAAVGERETARRFLELGRKAPLLPEERKLLEQADAIAR